MKTLKDNIQDISEETKSIIKNYISIFTVKQSEKLAMLLGLLASVFVFSIIFLIVIVFLSIALSIYLNNLLGSEYLGFLIITGVYVLTIVFMILRMIVSKRPLFSNIFLRFIIMIFGLNITYGNSFRGLRQEIEKIENEIDKNKIKINADVEITRYLILETIITDFFGLFKTKTKDKTDNEKPIKDDNKDEADINK
jgi:hypothetical protein